MPGSWGVVVPATAGRGVVTVSADLRGARPADLEAVLARLVPGRRGFVAGAAGSGTTVLAVLPGVGARTAAVLGGLP